MFPLRAESVKARRRRPVTADDRDDAVLTAARRRTAADVSGTAATATTDFHLAVSVLIQFTARP